MNHCIANTIDCPNLVHVTNYWTQNDARFLTCLFIGTISIFNFNSTVILRYCLRASITQFYLLYIYCLLYFVFESVQRDINFRMRFIDTKTDTIPSGVRDRGPTFFVFFSLASGERSLCEGVAGAFHEPARFSDFSHTTHCTDIADGRALGEDYGL